MLVRARGLIGNRPEVVSFGMQGGYTLAAFLTTVLIARLLGPVGAGVYYEALAWVLLLSGAVQSGWGPLLVREVSGLRDQERHSELLGIVRIAMRFVLALGALAAVALAAGTWLVTSAEGTFALYLVAAPAIILLSTTGTQQAVARGLGRTLAGQLPEYVLRPGLQLLGLAVLLIALPAASVSPLDAMAVFLIAVAAAAALAWYVERKALGAIGTSEEPTLPPRGEWLPPLLHNALIGWASTANLQVGTLAVAWVASPPEVTDLRIGIQLAALLALGLTSVNAIYGRDFSRFFVRGDFEGMQQAAVRSSRFSFATALPMALFFLLFGREFIAFFFGPEFSGAFVPLLILVGGQLANALFGSVTFICIATRNEGAVLKAQLAAAALNILLCFALAPFFGATGAAAGSAMALLLWNVALFVFLRRRFGLRSMAFASRGLS